MGKTAILVTGGNAAGKTTAVEKALELWPGDDRIFSARADNDGRFKGTAEQQYNILAQLWTSEVPVIIIEGTRINTPLIRVSKAVGQGDRDFHILVALQTADVMRAHLLARCLKKGKEFRGAYWTRQKLEYEGLKRYPNVLRKAGAKFKPYQVDLEYESSKQLVADIQAIITVALS